MYLLDTNAVIDFFGNKLSVTGSDLVSNISNPAISVVTTIELFALVNMPVDEKNKLQEFVNYATVYNHINDSIVAAAIDIRQLHKIKLPDAIIAATALIYNLTLITRNTTDFKNIIGLEVINPYDL